MGRGDAPFGSTDERRIEQFIEEHPDARFPQIAGTFLLDPSDERVRLRAAEAILDRAGLTKAGTARLTTVKTEVGDDVDTHDRDISTMLEY